MSNKKYSKEFKLKLIKEHEDNGVSFYAIGLILLIGACGSGGAFFYLNPWSSSTKRIWFRNTIFRSFDPTGSAGCPIHMKQAGKPSHIDKQDDSE